MFLLPLRVAGITAALVAPSEQAVFAPSPEAIAEAHRSLREAGLPAILLVTCHRIELTWWGDGDGVTWLHRWLAAQGADVPRHGVWCREADLAVRHLFALAAGLESPLRGEAEIHGQLRAAWRSAVADDVTTPPLDAVLARVIDASRRIRAAAPATGAARSVGTAATSVLRQRLASTWADARIAVVGTGEAATQVVRALVGGDRPGRVDLVGRTPARVETLAGRYGVEGHDWASLPDVAAAADAVVFAVRSRSAVVATDDVRRWCHASITCRRVWIDLGMPPAVDPAAGTLVDLVGLSQLGDAIGAASGDVAPHQVRAHQALQLELARFAADVHRRHLGDAVSGLYASAIEIARDEAARATRTASESLAPGAVEALSLRVAQRVLFPALRVLAEPATAP